MKLDTRPGPQAKYSKHITPVRDRLAEIERLRAENELLRESLVVCANLVARFSAIGDQSPAVQTARKALGLTQ